MTSHRLPSQPAHAVGGASAPTTTDPLRRAVEHQVAGLIPVAAALQGAVAHPTVAPAEWHGPASDAYDGLEARLRSRVAVADRAVWTVLQTSRLALAELGG